MFKSREFVFAFLKIELAPPVAKLYWILMVFISYELDQIVKCIVMSDLSTYAIGIKLFALVSVESSWLNSPQNSYVFLSVVGWFEPNTILV